MGLKDKAARIDFSALPGVASTPAGAPAQAPGGPEARRPRTAPGAMMEFAGGQRSELVRENEALREKAARTEELRGKLDEALADLQGWDGAKAARLLDPKSIRRSRFANRDERNFTGAAFAELKAEIASAGGNVQPIKVRPVPGGEFEVVFGHRRLHACLELGLPVLAMIDSIDDRSMFVEMDRENRGRKDLSAWEQGVMYRRALGEGLFPSNRKLAEAVGADLSAVGKALSLAELPAEAVAAFQSPLELQFRWAKPLRDAHDADPKAFLARAEAVKGQGLPAREVFDRLVSAGKPGVEPFHPPAPTDIVVDGKRVGKLAFNAKGGAVVTFESGVMAPKRAAALAKALEGFLRAK